MSLSGKTESHKVEASIRPIQFLGDRLRLLDQTKLPYEEAYIDLFDDREVTLGIKEMRVRGAPAIGVAAAYGVALAAGHLSNDDRTTFMQELAAICQRLRTARPTAVNLAWAVERLWQRAQEVTNLAQIKEVLLAEAQRIDSENEEANRLLSRHGAMLLRDGSRVLTYCNTGALATGASYGTALGSFKRRGRKGSGSR